MTHVFFLSMLLYFVLFGVFSVLENNLNQDFLMIQCPIYTLQLHLVEFAILPSINTCLYLTKASHHYLSKDFTQENNSVTAFGLLKNGTVWLHFCSHMCPCLSALCHLFCRGKVPSLFQYDSSVACSTLFYNSRNEFLCWKWESDNSDLQGRAATRSHICNVPICLPTPR